MTGEKATKKSAAETPRSGNADEGCSYHTDGDSGYVFADSNTVSLTTHPVTEGQEIGLSGTYAIPPGCTFIFFANGRPGNQVTVSLERVPGSGGHNHGGATDSPFAVGTLTPTSFTLGNYPQNVQVLFRAPTVCGAIRMFGRFSNGRVAENRIETFVSGLLAIPASPNLRLKPPRPEHPSPYWASPAFIDKLVLCANSYAQQSGKPLTVTDASLEWGGRFDLQQDWIPPHHEHMDGHQADLRSNDMSRSDKKKFLQAAKDAGLSVLDESDHWHVRG